MTLDAETVKKIDLARMNGASAGEVLQGLMKSGVPDPERAFRAYAQLPLPDGRKRSQVNLGDPAEWS